MPNQLTNFGYSFSNYKGAVLLSPLNFSGLDGLTSVDFTGGNVPVTQALIESLPCSITSLIFDHCMDCQAGTEKRERLFINDAFLAMVSCNA